MIIKFKTNNPAILIDSRACYEFDNNVGVDELNLFVKEVLGFEEVVPLKYTIETHPEKLQTSLIDHMRIHLPRINVDERTITIKYERSVEIMGLLKLSN